MGGTSMNVRIPVFAVSLALLALGLLAFAPVASAQRASLAERVAALRNGFLAATSDKELLDDAQKAGLAIHAMNGEDLQKAYAAFFTMPKDVVARAKAITRVEGAE